MRDARWQKAWRDLVTSGGSRLAGLARSALVVLALAVALSGAGAVLTTWALVRQATGEGYRASLPVSASFRVEDADDALWQPALLAIRAHPDIAAARARRVVGAAVQGQGAWRSGLLVALQDFAADDIGRLKLEAPLNAASGSSSPSAAWPPAAGTLAVERSSMEFAGAVLGESLGLKGAAATEPQAVAVSAIVRDVSLAPGWMEHVVYAFATRQTLGSLGLGTAWNELQVRVRDNAAGPLDRDGVRRVAAAVREQLQRAGLRVTSVDVPPPGEHIHARQMNSLLYTQAAFGVLALLVSCVLVVNLLSALLVAQGRQIGVMKVLGAPARQLATMFLAQAAALGMAACAIALPLSLWIGRRYAGFKAEMLNFPMDGVSLPLWLPLLLLAVGVGLPVLAAWWPVRGACGTPVGELLRDIGIVARGAPLALRRWQGSGWSQRLPRPLLLALGNAFRRRQRMLLTLLALALGGAVLVGAGNLRRAVQGSVDLLFASQHYDLSLRLAPPQSAASAVAVAAAVPGVVRAEAWRGRRAHRVASPVDAAGAAQADAADDHADSHDGALLDTISLVGVAPDGELLRPQVLEGRWLSAPVGATAAPRELVLSRSLALDQPELRPGHTLRLAVDGVVARWAIVGIVDSGPQPLAYASRLALKDGLSAGAPDFASSLIVALEARSAASQLEATLRLRDALAAAGMPVATSQLQAENRRVVEDHLLMVVDFLAVMGWVMMAVGGVALASTMGLSVLERVREIGVLRAIGASDAAVMGLVQIEGLVVTLLAWLLCLPLSVPIGAVLGEAFGRVMFRVPFSPWPDAGSALRWLAAMLLVSLLACAGPAWRSTRVPAARALAYAG